MDISGYRGRPNRIGNPGGSWASGLDDPSGKRKRGRGLSLGARALLLLLLVVVVWAAIRSASSHGGDDDDGAAEALQPVKTAQAAGAGTAAADSGGRGSAAAAAGRAATGKAGGDSGGGRARAGQDPAKRAELQAKLDQQAEARIERQVGGPEPSPQLQRLIGAAAAHADQAAAPCAGLLPFSQHPPLNPARSFPHPALPASHPRCASRPATGDPARRRRSRTWPTPTACCWPATGGWPGTAMTPGTCGCCTRAR